MDSNTSSAMVVAPAPQASSMMTAVAPRSLDDVARLATAVAKSGLYGVRSADDAFIRMVTAAELGITPMAGLRTISVVQGKPVLDAALIAGLCMRHPECESWHVVETSATRCVIETRRARHGVTRHVYTMEEAKAAGLTAKDNWRHYPAAMLRARCVSSLARIAYPDVIAGIYTPDELDRSAPPPVDAAVEVVSRDGEVIDSGSQPAIVEVFLGAIADAKDAPALAAVGLQVKGTDLSAAERARIREAYSQRQRVMRAASKRKPAPTPPPEPSAPEVEAEPVLDEPPADADLPREPGEEG